jgi:hypothetical protein
LFPPTLAQEGKGSPKDAVPHGSTEGRDASHQGKLLDTILDGGKASARVQENGNASEL